MSKLQNSAYHDEENRTLEIDFADDGIHISIEWWEGNGVRVESFFLNSEESRRFAKDILERIPDPMILEDNLLMIDSEK